jgi:hypothetical protein
MPHRRRASAADLKSLQRKRGIQPRDFKSKSGTRIINLLVPIAFRSSRKIVAARERELRKVGTRLARHHFDLAVLLPARPRVGPQQRVGPNPVGLSRTLEACRATGGGGLNRFTSTLPGESPPDNAPGRIRPSRAVGLRSRKGRCSAACGEAPGASLRRCLCPRSFRRIRQEHGKRR